MTNPVPFRVVKDIGVLRDHTRRTMLTSSVALATAAFAAGSAIAQKADEYPARPVRLVVGFAPGGSNDILARIIGERLAAEFGQPFVVENKPGAGGMLAASSVMAADPDGLTLLVGAAGAMAIGPAVYTRMAYDTLRDFAPVSILGEFPLLLLVSADSPFRTVQDLVRWSKDNPDKANYATASPTFTLAAELLKLKTGAKLTRVTYRGTNDAVLAVLSGQTTATVSDPLPALPLIRDGKLRALAITSRERSQELPDVPTMREAGVPDSDALIWTGLFAPKATPAPIVTRLEAAIGRIMKEAAVRERLRTLATEASSGTAKEFAARIAADTDAWSQVAKAADVKIDP